MDIHQRILVLLTYREPQHPPRDVLAVVVCPLVPQQLSCVVALQLAQDEPSARRLLPATPESYDAAATLPSELPAVNPIVMPTVEITSNAAISTGTPILIHKFI
jgi:hypothetical protein